jgi:hypothetical protein
MSILARAMISAVQFKAVTVTIANTIHKAAFGIVSWNSQIKKLARQDIAKHIYFEPA